MEDDVPVSDVLCEAMDYLSKLGTNLRTRSDILKEKKIRKDKLKNTHAVQKAADKVLLICELSKKSLENVESGVKRILTIIGKSKAASNNGAKHAKPDSDKISRLEKRDLYHFVYQSRKLKIAKKISLAHFMSVKVSAERMPRSKIDRYPIYYSCKLFRLRQKKAQQERNERTRKSVSASPTNKISKDPKKCEEQLKKEKEDVSKQDKKYEKADSRRNSDNSDTKQKDKVSISADKTSSSKSKNKQNYSGSDAYESDTEKSQGGKSSKHMHDGKEKNKMNKFIDSDSSDGNVSKSDSLNKPQPDHDSKESKNHKEKGKSKTKRLIYSDSSDGSISDSVSKSGKNSEEKEKSMADLDSDSSNVLNSDKIINTNKCQPESLSNDKEVDKDVTNGTDRKLLLNESDRRKEGSDADISETSDSEKKASQSKHGSRSNYKHKRRSNNSKHVRKDSSDSDIEFSNKNDENSVRTEETDSISKETKDGQNESDSNAGDTRQQQAKTISKESNNKEKSHESENCDADKPIIKCVSISKLLKPEILQPTVEKRNTALNKANEGSLSKSKEKSKTSAVLDKSRKSYDKSKKRVRYEDEEKFWAQKRKEVAAFKPRDFSVMVTRLPSFDEKFLNEHKIARVIEKDSVVFEKKLVKMVQKKWIAR